MLKLQQERSERRAKLAANSIRATALALLGSSRAGEDHTLHAANSDFAAMLEAFGDEVPAFWPSIRGWLVTMQDVVRPKPVSEPASAGAPSWQDVHRRDTFGLTYRHVMPGDGADGSPELGWARENAALLHLLRIGLWQSVPASPPDCWVHRLTSSLPGSPHWLRAGFSPLRSKRRLVLPRRHFPNHCPSMSANGSGTTAAPCMAFIAGSFVAFRPRRRATGSRRSSLSSAARLPRSRRSWRLSWTSRSMRKEAFSRVSQFPSWETTSTGLRLT